MDQKLLCDNTDLAEEAYSSVFIQGMRDGTLSPTNYAKMELQLLELYEHARKTLGTICDSNADCDDETKTFFEKTQQHILKWVVDQPTEYALVTVVDPSTSINVLDPTMVKMLLTPFEENAFPELSHVHRSKGVREFVYLFCFVRTWIPSLGFFGETHGTRT